MTPEEREELAALRRMAELEDKFGKAKPTFGQAFKDELLTSVPGGIVRGVKDVVDTGAEGLAWAYDKLRGPTMSSLIAGGEHDRVKAMNEAGKADFKAAQERSGAGASDVARIAGNVAGTAPILGFGGAALTRAGAPSLGSAFGSGGMTTGQASSGLRDLAIRILGGAGAGYIGAGAVDPSSANTGAAIGAAAPGLLKAAGAAGNAAAGVVRPFVDQKRIVADVLLQHMDNPKAAIEALKNAKQIVPGSKPLTAAAAGDVGLAGLTRGMQNTPGFANELANIGASQNAARTAALENIAGNKGKIAVAEAARKAATDPMREGVLSRARGVDSDGLLSGIGGMLKDPNNAGRHSQKALSEYAAQIAKHTQGGEINARALYELRKDIGKDIAGKVQGEDSSMRYAAGQLNQLQSMIDDAIEKAAQRASPQSTGTALSAQGGKVALGPQRSDPVTGWGNYLSTYSDMSRPIDRMEAIQDVLKRTQTGTPDAAANLILSPAKLNQILKNEGDDLAKLLKPEELQVLRNVSADMNAGHLALNAGKAVGSNTFQNFGQDTLLRSALGKVGGSTPVTSTIGRVLSIPYGRANEQIKDKLGEALADPDVALEMLKRLPSEQRDQFIGLLSPLFYRSAPLVSADR